MPHEVKPLPFDPELNGISAKTNEIHHDKLYAGYAAKRNEVEQKMADTDLASANQTYSAWRGLKEGETFAANGMILHEAFFGILGGDGDPDGTGVKEGITTNFGSWERFVQEFTATAMAARGWSILAFDPSDNRLHIYAADAQNQGGVWGCTPVLLCDVYEHSYFLDHGSDRKAYVEAFFTNIDWKKVDARYNAITKK
jgi:Fe-Mn family superoxide dismutase